MQTNILSGGFADAAIQSAHAFRSVMEAMARPGTIQNLEGASPPSPLSPAAGAVLLTLCDTETPLYLAGCMDCDDVRAWVSFHVGAPLCGSGALYVCNRYLGRACAAVTISNRHSRTPRPLGHAHCGLRAPFTNRRKIDRSWDQRSSKAVIARTQRVSGK